MLVHHGKEQYDVAASVAAEHAREKLGVLIEQGRARAGAVIQQVQEQVPQDAIVPATRFHFDATTDRMRVVFGSQNQPIHDHALSQAAERVGLPWRYVQDLRDKDWGRELVAHNFNTLLSKLPDTRYLVRSVTGSDGTQVRGILSDRFRRLDSRPIVESFAKAVQAVGALPYEGYALETKIAIKAILPMVFEPVPNEIMAFGVVLGNSDFGDGALSLRAFMLRLFCTNLGILNEALRQVHLGGQLPSDMAFSDRTYRLDTERSASMIQDVVVGELGPSRIEAMMNTIRKANEEKVSAGQVGTFLKKHLGIGEAEAVRDAFNSADIENMPAGQTAWRLSNAVSWIAGNTQDESRRLDLMKIAALALPEASKN